MAKKSIPDIEKLIKTLDKKQLADFIRKECANDSQLHDRFLALGAGTLFAPDPQSYADRITDLIEDFSGRHGYIGYRDTFDFNNAACRILEEAEGAMSKGQWRVAMAVLTGVSDVGEDILNSGDDSAGELGGVLSECFEIWKRLVESEVPYDVSSDIFEHALQRFKDKHLKGWGDWWWDWIDMAIALADTPERQAEVLMALDAVPRPKGDDWSGKFAYEEAQKYRLKMMSKCGTPEQQRKFMYDNVSNSDFRQNLLALAWEEGNIDEVIRLAQQGVEQDEEDAPGLVSDWKEWEMKAFQKLNVIPEIIRLAKWFFLNGSHWRQSDYSFERMYNLLKRTVDKPEWPRYVDELERESMKVGYHEAQLLHIYTQEELWDRYMDYLRQDPNRRLLEEAPKDLKRLYKEEFINLYAECVRRHFQYANKRDDYREGVSMLSTLQNLGGKSVAAEIITEQKNRRPRRPALIEELTKLK